MSSDDNPELPQHVVVEILKGLPVESLLRLRCVCRSWRSTIDDPCFVALHLKYCAVGASKWHTACLDWRDRLCSLFSDESLTLPPQSQIQIPFSTPTYWYDIVGSCNGWICIDEISRKRTVHLWNLFTRKHRPVIVPNVEYLSLALGFGFDARSSDARNGELLMVIDGGGRVSWNPITRQFENLPISTKGNMITVVESLVSL